MSKTEKIFIAILALVFIAVFVEVGTFIWPQISGIPLQPTKMTKVTPASSTEISNLVTFPTVKPTLIPTLYIKKPTWTPPPIETPLLVKISTRPPTPKPNPTVIADIPNSANSNCSAQYAYIESVHQYNVDYIHSAYKGEISYYQSLLVQANADHDWLGASRIQQQIDQLKSQRDAAINSENSRYQGEKAYLDAQCR